MDAPGKDEDAAPDARNKPANALGAIMMRTLAQDGTLVRLARHQQVALATVVANSAFLIKTGTIALETELPERHILGFCHSGDLLEARHLPNLPQLSLRAVENSELWRIRQKQSIPTSTDAPEMVRAHQRLSSQMVKRQLVTNVILGRLTGEQRLVSFLISTTVRLGRVIANQATTTMPMSRADIADYLGLNPDTLSRLMTVLHNDGLVETQGRHRLVIRDWESLCARTPIAQAIIDAG